MASKLHFGEGNAKLSLKIGTFSLPAGKTCMGAYLCKTWVSVNENGNANLIQSELNAEDEAKRFRCFAASAEVRFPSYRNAVNENLEALREAGIDNPLAMADLIHSQLPQKYPKFRIHVGGDFFNEEYLLAWNMVAKRNPGKIFYAYTKSIPFWVKYKNDISPNFVLTASYGGIYDKLIEANDLKRVKVYFHPDDARAAGVEIDHDDSLAMDPSVKEFGLLLHGSQPKDSQASKALSKMKKENIDFGYHQKPKN